MERPKLHPKLFRVAKVLLLVPAALLAFACFTGRFTKHIQSASPGPVPASEISGRRLQWSTEDCELVQWDDLCGHQLPVGRCFRIQPQTPSVCELLGPGNSEEASLLLGDGFVTLQTEGTLRITGNLRVRSARFEAESVFFRTPRWRRSRVRQTVPLKSAVPSTAKEPLRWKGRTSQLQVAELVGVVAWLLVATLPSSRPRFSRSPAAWQSRTVGAFTQQEHCVFEEAPKSLWRRHRRHEVEASSQVVRWSLWCGPQCRHQQERSLVRVRQTRAAGLGGGFMAEGMLNMAAGNVDLEHTHALRSGGGFAVNGSVLATDGSAIRIRNSSTESSAGGFLAQGKYVKLTNKSGIHMQNVRAKQYAGGFYARSGSVIVANMSEITVVNGHVAKYDGGAFVSRSHLQVDDGSTIRLQNVSAGRSGGGFTAPRARVFVRGNSEVLISDSHAKDGGGFYVAFLEVSNNAVVGIQKSTAGRHGGGFYACGCNNTFVRSMDRNVVVVSHSSTLRIENTIAERRGGFLSAGSVMLAVFSKLLISDSQTMRKDGGGFYLFGSLQIEDGSILRVRNVYAYKLGGAFAIDAADTAGAKATVVVRNKSVISIDNATAGLHAGGFHTGRNGRILVTGHSKMRIADCRGGNGHGGGFFTDRLQVSDHGAVTIRNCSAGGDSDGGGFYAQFGHDKTEAAVVLADSSTLSIHATNASYAGGFSTPGQVVIASNSMLRISESHASTFSGGFSSSTLQVIDHSAVFLENVTAAQEIGGFTAGQGLVVSNGSEISIRRAVVEKSRAGFASFGPIVVAKNSQISVSDSFARNGCCGGFSVRQELAGALAAVQVTGGSTISISNTAARLEGGGFAARRGDIVVNNGSKITIRNTASSSSYGGGFSAEQGVLVSNNSLITIRDSTSREHSGGFCSKRLEVTSRSAVQIERTQAGGSGGGFSADDAVVAGQSKVTVSDSHAIEGSGGGFQTAKLYLEGNSSIDLRTTSAGNSGGGVYADNFKAGSHALVVANGSTLGVRNATARVDGGGLCIYGRAVITGWSKVHTSDCHTTLLDGGGVAVFESLLLNESSDVHIQNATAGRSGGGLHAEGTITIAGSSTLATSNTSCEEDGGGFHLRLYASASTRSDSPPGLALHDGMFVVSDSRSTGKGAAGFVQDRVFLGPGSGLYVHKAVGSDLSSVVAARSLQLSPGATVLLEDAVGGLGLDLRNSDCPSALANRTVEIAAGASLKASGRLGSGFLSLETCPFEVVHLSGIHLQSWSSPLLSTRAHKVVVRDVSIDYEPPLHDVLVLATIDSFKADSLDVSCKNCTHRVALNATGSVLRALSTPLLICPLAASVSGGMLQRCTCANYQTTRQAYTDRQVVMLPDIMNTCTFCAPHTQFINGTCQKCPPFNAWSDGKSDVCHVLPQDSAQVGALFAASASCVFLAFVFYQILDAPLVIVDAKSQRIPHRLRKAAGKFPEGMEQRSFSMSLQGPIVDLPQFLSRQLHRQLCYHVKGTGLQWLDFSPENAQAVKIQSIDRSKLEVQDAHVPYDCAAAVGALHATNLLHLMLPLCAAVFLVVLLPVALQVAIMSGNGIAHVLVTSAYCALPAGLAALILHPVVAWLIEQHCRRTPFSKLLDNYRRRIQCDPHPGPDAVHPSNQGFMVLTLWELWGHFESFILDRNMHFVVNNIIRPLTCDRQVSFVSLWGGRQVDYFVSHSWATSFAHFVRSIHSHARSREGQRWMDVSYWICSFANNQWNLGVELGETIMDSAFARTLRSGIKGVAMVLDHEVQPLTRVWCLFEFLLSKQLELELVFATDVGVIGDDGCTSFDIALELGNKIESLQVANCYASSDGDRTRIFDFIVSSLGSLESMDDQIRDLMGQMLEKNLANVGFATNSLLQRLGQNARSASAFETV